MKPSPSSNLYLNFGFRRIKIRSINSMVFFVIIFAAIFFGLYQYKYYEIALGKLSQKYLSKIKHVTLENSILRSQNEVLNNLRVDLVNEFSVANRFGNLSRQQLMVGEHFKIMAYFYTLRSLMERNLDTLNLYIKNLKLKNAERAYLQDWILLTFSFLDQLETRDFYWRKHKHEKLKKFIHAKFEMLQNNCSTNQRKLVCNPTKSCGIGCLMHHYAYCFTAALALNRTLIFTDSSVLLDKLQPLNSTCSDMDISDMVFWSELNVTRIIKTYDDVDTIYLPAIDSINEYAFFMPLVIPKQLEIDLKSLSTMPFSLFIGYILDYIFRPSQNLATKISQYTKRLQVDQNAFYVGIHVRRTDKLRREAKYHPLREYMEKVEEIYDRIELQAQMKGIKKNNNTYRLVYLATDDPYVWKKEVPFYLKKNYLFIGDSNFSKNAAPSSRNKPNSIDEILLDVWMLSASDYLVCTFSSQICRLAFELMQVKRPEGRDMALKAFTIDDPYYFGGQLYHGLKAIVPNKAQTSGEANFDLGDVMGISNDLQNGYLIGEILKSRNPPREKYLLKYPKFKVIEEINTNSFKAFEETFKYE